MHKVSQEEVSIPTLKGLEINCISQLSLNYKCLLKRYRSQYESFLEAQLQILILSNTIYTSFRKTKTPQNHVLDRFCRVQSQTCTHSCIYCIVMPLKSMELVQWECAELQRKEYRMNQRVQGCLIKTRQCPSS